MNGLPPLLRCIVIVPLMIGTACAAPLRDERTGVLIDLPEGWEGQRPVGRLSETFRLHRKSNETVLDQADCEAMIIGPQYKRGGAGYNEILRTRKSLNRLKYEWSMGSTLVSVKRSIKGSITRVIAITDREGNPRRRSMEVQLASPNVLIIMTCSANLTSFKMFRPEFEAIVHGVTFPE